MQNISKRITSNKTKHLLVESELKKLKIFDLSYFKTKSHFEEDGTQNYLVFQPIQKYFKRIAGVGSGNYIYKIIIIYKNYNISSYPALEKCLF